MCPDRRYWTTECLTGHQKRGGLIIVSYCVTAMTVQLDELKKNLRLDTAPLEKNSLNLLFIFMKFTKLTA